MNSNPSALINPRLCKKYGIYVEVDQLDGRNIPYLIVYPDRAHSYINCSYVRLDSPDYCDKYPIVELSPLVKSSFIDVMISTYDSMSIAFPNGIVKHPTGYEFAVTTWVDTYENDYSKFIFDSNGTLVMPDYSLL